MNRRDLRKRLHRGQPRKPRSHRVLKKSCSRNGGPRSRKCPAPSSAHRHRSDRLTVLAQLGPTTRRTTCEFLPPPTFPPARSGRSGAPASWPAKHCAELLLLHVVNQARAGSADGEVREAERMLAEQVAAVPELAGVHARATMRTGNPGEAIHEIAVSQRVNHDRGGRATQSALFRAARPKRSNAVISAGTVSRAGRQSRGEGKLRESSWLRSICRTSRRRRCSRRSGSGSMDKADVTVDSRVHGPCRRARCLMVGVMKDRIRRLRQYDARGGKLTKLCRFLGGRPPSRPGLVRHASRRARPLR